MPRPRSLRRAFVITFAVSTAVVDAYAVPPPNPAQCPQPIPTEGAACAPADLRCGYNLCISHWTRFMRCDAATHQWRRDGGATCNPPRPVHLPPYPLPSRNPPPHPPPVRGG